MGCDWGVGPSSQRFQRYTVTDLNSVLGLPDATINAVNDSSHIVGRRLVGGETRGFRWSDGLLADLPCLPTAINTKGQIGCNIAGSGGIEPAMWDAGDLIHVLPAGRTGSVEFLTDSGHVVGSTLVSGSSGMYRWRGGALSEFGFRFATGQPNNAGDVPMSPNVGLYNRARVWFGDGSESNEFGSWHRYSRATAINDAGDVVGAGERVPGTLAFLARKGTPYVADSIGPPGNGGAVAIDNSGLVIGYGDGGTFVWKEGRSKWLADLLDTPGWTIAAVLSATPRGRILARGSNTHGTSYVLLTPVR